MTVPDEAPAEELEKAPKKENRALAFLYRLAELLEGYSTPGSKNARRRQRVLLGALLLLSAACLVGVGVLAYRSGFDDDFMRCEEKTVTKTATAPTTIQEKVTTETCRPLQATDPAMIALFVLAAAFAVPVAVTLTPEGTSLTGPFNIGFNRAYGPEEEKYSKVVSRSEMSAYPDSETGV